jgi:uncharacterized membrane protein
MKKTADFLKTTLLGGLVAIVPLSVVAFVLWSMLSALFEVIDAMEGVLSFSPWVNTVVMFFAALAALLVLCFLAGLALRTAIGGTLKEWIDSILVKVVPLYGMAKKMTQRLAGGDGSEFTPALIDLFGSSSRVLGWIVEELPEDRYAVFVPSTPAATFGQIYVVPCRAADPIDAHMAELMGPVTEWGAGTATLFSKGELLADSERK